MKINKRSIVVSVLLSLFTLGIYQLYWYYLLVKSERAIELRKNSFVGELLCLYLVPFYNVYWWFTRGKIVKEKLLSAGQSNVTSNEVLFLVLGIFRLDIVSMAIMQSDFNAISSDAYYKIRKELDDDFTPVEPDPQYILQVNALKKYFPIKGGFFSRTVGNVKAVDGVTFNLKRGTTMGLVGESGCGKTTAGRTILRLSGEKTGGQVLFNGQEVYDLNRKEMRDLRTKMQIIFQDPFSSLSPRLPVSEIIGEAVREHKIVPKEEYNDYIDKVMDNCGLQPFHKDRYPHEFSGGQRQRICIARALALNPEFIVCDEPVSALDVSIQAQIINLLKELQEKYQLTYLFISHDLSVVEHISDTVGVMYLGSLVEYGATEDIFKNPLHPYTKALFSAIPVPDPTAKMNRIVLEGSIPSPANPPAGCKFHTRCANCMERCKHEAPIQREIEPGHYVVCHLYDDVKEESAPVKEKPVTVKEEPAPVNEEPKTDVEEAEGTV